MNEELIKLAEGVINDANRYYEEINPDQEIPKILEEIVLGASRILQILKDKK